MSILNNYITYQNVASALQCHHAAIFPAEFHGYMCGIICGGNYTENEAGFRVVLGMLQDENFNSKEAKAVAAELMLNTFHQLHDVNCDFKLLLPDDEESINLRSHALAVWCQNFLGGLGLSGIDSEKIYQREINEAILDIAEIAKLKYSDLLDQDNEEQEMELMELIEYVRVAVLLIYTESMGQNDQSINVRH
ncbi:MAG: UPF0149 family protein [Gammaproteobacteria bacterium]|jgi:yecA family protein